MAATWPYTGGDPTEHIAEIREAILARYDYIEGSWGADPGAPVAGEWRDWKVYRDAIEALAACGSFYRPSTGAAYSSWATVATDAFSDTDWRTSDAQRCGTYRDIQDAYAALCQLRYVCDTLGLVGHLHKDSGYWFATAELAWAACVAATPATSATWANVSRQIAKQSDSEWAAFEFREILRLDNGWDDYGAFGAGSILTIPVTRTTYLTWGDCSAINVYSGDFGALDASDWLAGTLVGQIPSAADGATTDSVALSLAAITGPDLLFMLSPDSMPPTYAQGGEVYTIAASPVGILAACLALDPF